MRRSFRHTAMLLGALTALALLDGCAQQPEQAAGMAPKTERAASSSPALPAADLLQQRGGRLTPGQYRQLVLGNTLYRPLENGVHTRIYFASDGAGRLSITAPNGTRVQDSGRQTLDGNLACWQWDHAGGGRRMCFAYYWNGRLLTMVESDNSTLPAQFLVEKGKAAGL